MKEAINMMRASIDATPEMREEDPKAFKAKTVARNFGAIQVLTISSFLE
ncbi:unnamed protein product, partial [Prunus brigantina]